MYFANVSDKELKKFNFLSLASVCSLVFDKFICWNLLLKNALKSKCFNADRNFSCSENYSYFTEWMTLFDWSGLLLILCIIPLRYTDHKAQWMVASLAFLFNFLRIFKFSCVTR